MAHGCQVAVLGSVLFNHCAALVIFLKYILNVHREHQTEPGLKVITSCSVTTTSYVM